MSAINCSCPTQFPQWHQQYLDLGRYCVFKSPVPMFLNMPIGFDFHHHQQAQQLIALELEEVWPGLCFLKPGFFRGELWRFIKSCDSPARQVGLLPPTFPVYTYLHPGDIGSLKPALAHMQHELLEQGKMPKEVYLAYLTCPLCADAKNGHKILVLRRWQPHAGLLKKVSR